MIDHPNTMKKLNIGVKVIFLLLSYFILHTSYLPQPCKAQNLQRVQTRHFTLYPQGPLDITDTLGWLLTATTNGGHQWNWPDANGTTGQVLSTDGAAPANLSWISITTGID